MISPSHLEPPGVAHFNMKKVTDASSMFESTPAFNQDISRSVFSVRVEWCETQSLTPPSPCFFFYQLAAQRSEDGHQHVPQRHCVPSKPVSLEQKLGQQGDVGQHEHVRKLQLSQYGVPQHLQHPVWTPLCGLRVRNWNGDCCRERLRSRTVPRAESKCKGLWSWVRCEVQEISFLIGVHSFCNGHAGFFHFQERQLAWMIAPWLAPSSPPY